MSESEKLPSATMLSGRARILIYDFNGTSRVLCVLAIPANYRSHSFVTQKILFLLPCCRILRLLAFLRYFSSRKMKNLFRLLAIMMVKLKRSGIVMGSQNALMVS